MWFAFLKQVRLIVVLICFCRTGTPAITNTTMLRFVPTNLSILEGNSGTLTCNISNSDPGVYFIRWNAEVSHVYHPQENCRVTGPLTNTQAYNVTCINEDVQIAILNVSRDRHSEVWTCQRVFIDNNYYESKSTLTVTVPVTNVRLETQNAHTRTKENTPTKFECVTSAGYPEATLRWYKNNTLLNNSDISTYSTLSYNYLKIVSSTLTLHLRRAENSSRIHCAAKNNGTTWQYSNRTTVIVYYAPGVPIITKDSRPVQGDFAVKEGNRVNVVCAASSFPGPTHSWTIPNGTSIAGDRLQITKIARAGGGNYTCKAINTMRLSSGETIQGENKSSINVHVLYAPSQPTLKYMRSDSYIHNSSIDKSLYVVRNDNFTLTCATDSQPLSSYRWNWTGNQNIQETNTNTLTVVSIQDDMNLTCTATNTMKETFGMTSTQSANSTISIIVLYPPRNPEFSATNGDKNVQENVSYVNVTEGDTITITCQADSRPAPYGYYWPVESFKNNAAMRLTNVKRTKTGRYSCEARNRMNRTFGNPAEGKQRNAININVLYPPTQPTFIYNNISGSIITDGIVKVIRGKSAKVVCNTSGNPVPVYNWYNTAVTPGQLLEVINIANDTTWTCRVTNNLTDSFGIHNSGEDKRELSLEILFPPTAIKLKVNEKETTTNTVRVVEGSNVTLSCDASSKPPPSKYTWFKLPSATLPTATTREYKIVSINRTQAGQYTCIVENVMHPLFEKPENGTISKNLGLEILYPTKIDTFKVDGHTTDNVTANEKDNITFVCNVEGKPESNVSFWHEGTPLNHATVMNNVNHTVTNVTCVQHGQYACAANNMYNTEHPVKYLTLFVRCSPRPKPNSELQEVFASALNVDTTINFEVLAYPTPTDDGFKFEKEITNSSTWKEVENNDNILVSSYGVQSNLTLKNVSKSSFGNYRLTVRNVVGTYTHQFVFKAEDKPEAPTNFHHVKELATDSTLTFKWSPGFDGGPVQTFLLHYRKANSKANWLVQSIPDNGRPIMNTSLGFLTSSTMYDVYLIASNEKGNSSAVEITAVHTGATPILKPSNRIIPAVSAVSASVVVMCVIIVIFMLYKRQQNKMESSEMHPGAATTNVSKGVYENVCSDRNDDANKDGTDTKSHMYQNAPDPHLPSSATSSKQSSSVSQEAAAPVPSHTIYENLILKAF